MIGSSDDFYSLALQLRRWDRRRRWAKGLLWLPRGILAGLLGALIVAAFARLRPFLTNLEVAYVAGALIFLGLVLSLVLLLGRKQSLINQARFADSQFELRERASTAVEIHSGLLQTRLRQAQLSDTLLAVARTDTTTSLPLRPNWRELLSIVLFVVLLVVALLLPNPQVEILSEERAVAASVDEQILSLEALEEEIRQNSALDEEQRRALLEPIEGALQELGEGGLSREQAVAVLSEAEAELRELAGSMGGQELAQTLRDAAQTLAESATAQALSQALQSGNLAAASSAMNQLADALADLDPAAAASLAESLARAAAALENIDSRLAAAMSEAAAALQEGDTMAADQALREAASTLQERNLEQAAAQQAQAAAEQLDQRREELAQAGQPGQPGQQGQPGQGQNGEGQAAGQGGGQGQGPAEGQGSGVAPGIEQGEGTGGPGPGGGHSETIFVPEFVDLSAEEGVEIELPAECVANPSNCGSLIDQRATEFGSEASLVPYDQVFGDYREAAYQALEDDYVPLGLKGFVRDYFSSLEP